MRALSLLFIVLAFDLSAQSPFNIVRQKLENEQLKEASRILDSCLKSTYQVDSSYYYKSVLLLRTENVKGAKQYRDKLVRDYPAFHVHYLNALILFTEKDFGKSIDEFNEVLKSEPGNLKALYNRSLAFGLLD